MRTLITAALAAASTALLLAPAAPTPAHAADLDSGLYGECWDAKGSWPCTVLVAVAGSERRFGPAHQEGDVYVNCTRQTVERQRSLSGTRPGRADFAAGKAANGTRRPTRFTWSEYTDRSLNEQVRPGEASWVEVEHASESGTATFTVTDGDGRAQTLTGTFDGPARGLPDRVYQRTGPLTDAERARCHAGRPTGAVR
ncbi:hypothetical protein ACIQUQ_19930 [Streptomyces sp. NPDC101118]|uniref:hypothetical protein n=1 Tax=Streptomyces sp. NPDC101118 TaxID=3366109 RepID=UPI00382BDDAA